MYTIASFGTIRMKKFPRQDVSVRRKTADGAKATIAEKNEAKRERAAARKAKLNRHP